MRQPGASKIQDPSQIAVQGIAWHETTIVSIRWEWIIGPAVFATFAVLFVLTTILSFWQDERCHTWKSSTSALLHALGPQLLQQEDGLVKPSQLRHLDQKMAVRLTRNPGHTDWRLVSGREDTFKS